MQAQSRQVAAAPVRHAPVEVAPDTFVIQATHGEGTAPLAIHMNAMVIRAEQPVVVDTGAPVNRDQYLDDLFSLVEPNDVRWVFLSHDDADHYGNLGQVMEACPNATFVGTWFLCERLLCEGFEVPPTRWRWIADGESLDVGDRVLAAVTPPLYDSPTTRGLFDSKTGVYWAADCYASPVERSTAYVGDLDLNFWKEGFASFQAWNSPWITMVDRARYATACRRVEELDPSIIASTHGPAITAASMGVAFELLRSLPDLSIAPQPGQPVLDEIIASMSS